MRSTQEQGETSQGSKVRSVEWLDKAGYEARSSWFYGATRPAKPTLRCNQPSPLSSVLFLLVCLVHAWPILVSVLFVMGLKVLGLKPTGCIICPPRPRWVIGGTVRSCLVSFEI